METIKNYLDSMFANLPSNPEVRRAKDELWQMMEDKYGELISEGKSENEAVGTVISEFGNLSELAETLGLENEINIPSDNDENKTSEEEVSDSSDENESEDADYEKAESRVIAASEAEELVKSSAERSFKIALGVALCILAPLGPILTNMIFNGRVGGLGFSLLAGAIAGGVLIMVFGNKSAANYKAVRRENCTLSMDATKYVAGERSVYMRNYNLTLTLGIMLCALCWIPSMIASNILPRLSNAAGAVFFMTLAFGVMLIVYSTLRKKGYDNLLILNGEGTFKAEYEPDDENVKYITPAAEFCMSVYWPTITCIYLILSFTTFKWGITWIIWLVSGILYKPLKRALTEKADQ